MLLLDPNHPAFSAHSVCRCCCLEQIKEGACACGMCTTSAERSITASTASRAHPSELGFTFPSPPSSPSPDLCSLIGSSGPPDLRCVLLRWLCPSGCLGWFAPFSARNPSWCLPPRSRAFSRSLFSLSLCCPSPCSVATSANGVWFHLAFSVNCGTTTNNHIFYK